MRAPGPKGAIEPGAAKTGGAVRADPSPRGELKLRAAQGAYVARRWLPSSDLADFALYYWSARWDRVGRAPFDQEVLTQPFVQLVFERDDVAGTTASRIVGVNRRRFLRRLEGAGRVVGVALQPGALFAWLGLPASRLTDRALPLAQLLGGDVGALEASLLGAADEREQVERIERFLRPHARPPDAAATTVRRLFARISADPDLRTAEELVAASGVGARELQRLFGRLVGASPKWVLRRHRLIEAARLLEAGEALSLAELGASLGYFDQAHFIRDFKATVGRTPGSYAREAAAAGERGAPSPAELPIRRRRRAGVP